MGGVQYKSVVSWDATLVDVGFVTSNGGTYTKGLACSAIKITAGAPATNNGRFIAGAKIINAADGTEYRNTGSTSAAVWSLVDTGAGFTLPATVTDSTTTTTTSFSLIFSELTSGIGQLLQALGLTSGTVQKLIGGGVNMTTAASVQDLEMGAATQGAAQKVVTSGVYTDTAGIMRLNADSATSGILEVISALGLTTGTMRLMTGGGANMGATAKMLDLEMGAATNGTALKISTSGAYTGNGVRSLIAGGATTGVLDLISGIGITSGILQKIIAAQAVMTTGRYVSYNDGATEVFGIGTNGHLISTVSAATPSVVVTQQNGITNAALGAGSSDTCGSITTTGTNNNGGSTIITLSFGKTYTTAPKGIIISPANASAAGPNPAFVTANATTMVITIPASASAGATPSWNYSVIS